MLQCCRLTPCPPGSHRQSPCRLGYRPTRQPHCCPTLRSRRSLTTAARVRRTLPTSRLCCLQSHISHLPVCRPAPHRQLTTRRAAERRPFSQRTAVGPTMRTPCPSPTPRLRRTSKSDRPRRRLLSRMAPPCPAPAPEPRVPLTFSGSPNANASSLHTMTGSLTSTCARPRPTLSVCRPLRSTATALPTTTPRSATTRRPMLGVASRPSQGSSVRCNGFLVVLDRPSLLPPSSCCACVRNSCLAVPASAGPHLALPRARTALHAPAAGHVTMVTALSSYLLSFLQRATSGRPTSPRPSFWIQPPAIARTPSPVSTSFRRP